MARRSSTPPVVLTIAGTDSGGGAGIAADLRSFAAHGAFGTLVVTAVTAQNTLGVQAVAAQPAEIVDAQIASVLADLPVAAVKSGMLANAEIVKVVTAWAERGALPQLVVDPVMVAASGGQLLDAGGLAAYRELLSSAFLVTPNAPEAAMLLGGAVESRSDLREAARALGALGAGAALVKGGHLAGDESVDVLYAKGALTEFHAPRLASAHTHGTGCTLSAAIAAGLAGGMGLLGAVERAKRYVTAAIAAAASWELGAGPGPLDHGVWGTSQGGSVS
ncbi:MAG TPA: bifunctional hydroxymethylpyrimidine kinase/phosphomethylpyrimidine kinase [Acidimicrobiales bacterium]|nr:bifunctional hydroxymethylpyrimidine kinase/phosphomethylpyrimidine kinase [Acidimicrobiales bacterium]